MTNKPYRYPHLIETLGTKDSATQEEVKALGATLLEVLFETKDEALADRIIGPNYRQHNAGVPDGREPILGAIPMFREANTTLYNKHVISENDLVVCMPYMGNAHFFGHDELWAFDMFRIKDGKICEHWDNFEALDTGNPSGHAPLDGAFEIVDLDKTAENKTLVLSYIDAIMKTGSTERLAEFMAPDAVRRGKRSPDGTEGFEAEAEARAKDGASLKIETVHHAVAEGNFVFTASEGMEGDTPSSFFEMHRVADGKIVEHWQIVKPIPTEMAHDNGVF